MKYIDSLSEIHANTGGEVYRTEIAEILRYLDDHPELTGKTMTQSRYAAEGRDRSLTYMRGFDAALRETGTIVLPDPEPTNAEKLEAHLLDLLGVVEAVGNTGVHNMAYELDRAGVKAPGGDDE